MYYRYYPLGAILGTRSAGVPLDHWGIAGWPRSDGSQEVIHSRPPGGVQVTSLADFALGRPVEVIAVPWSSAHGAEVYRRAYSQIGLPWAPLANCEHFATWAFCGEPQSPQLRKYAFWAVVLGLGGFWLGGRLAD